jgi:hypothetical protein
MSNGTISENGNGTIETQVVEPTPNSTPLEVPAVDSQETAKSSKDAKISAQDVGVAIIQAYDDSGTDELKKKCNEIIGSYLHQIEREHRCCQDYNIIVLFDYGSLAKGDADRIYNSITKFKEKKPLLLVLYSRGGSAGSAYLIGKLCREYANDKFTITVPRMAKSAATLICCAANEIHMGSLSELGPIDPQINDLPALGLKYSVEHIAELVKRYPSSSDMLAKYLHSSLPLINLGYYERVAESSTQYAEKLLSTHKDNLKRPSKDIATELVYKYKDHGFVIDKKEAEEIFGEDIIKMNTPEYELGNSLYRALDFIANISDAIDYYFYFIGSLDSQGAFNKKRSS